MFHGEELWWFWMVAAPLHLMNWEIIMACTAVKKVTVSPQLPIHMTPTLQILP
jgi:hypothetical protein